MKPSFKNNEEMINLDTESGNMNFLPMRFSPALKRYERFEEFKNFKSKK